MTSAASESPQRAYLIAGASGMLGTALQRVLTQRGASFTAPAEGSFDITDPVAVRHRVAEFAESLAPGQLGVLVNAAAYTNVERAEDQPELAYLVNEHGPVLLARAARKAGLAFVHVSTDFVFDGSKDGAYTEADEPNPLSVYGATKLAGEVSAAAEDPDLLIVRTAWVFGPAGVNFPVKILEAARSRPTLSVVTDEVGSPTYTIDLAAGILGLVDAGATGLFHLAGAGLCSRYELAIEVLRLAKVESVVQPVTHDAFPTKAARPLNSVLDCSKAAELGVTMPEWRDATARFLAEIGELHA
jgi:dTDP-4-dehydrorhamnose reductase